MCACCKRAPGEPAFRTETCQLAAPALDDPDSPWTVLQQSFGLAPFDLDLLVVALAPDLERRYERLYAYLQDDVSRRRPTVDLALNLLCRSAAEMLLRRNHFAPEAPLIKQRLLHLIPEDEKTLTTPAGSHVESRRADRYAAARPAHARSAVWHRFAVLPATSGCCTSLLGRRERLRERCALW